MHRRSFLWYSLLFTTSCATAQPSRSPSFLPQNLTKIRLAIADATSLEELKTDYEPFRSTLAAVLEVNVEFLLLENQIAAAIALKQGQVDLVLAGPSEYVITRSRTNAVPLVGITRPNYHSIIAVPQDSPIQSLADLRGKTIAMSDIGSTSGHLGPTKMLVDAGFDPKIDVTIQMLGDTDSVAAIQQGKVDAWAGSTTTYQELLPEGFSIVAQSPPLPSDVIVAGSSLDPVTIDAIQTRILNQQDKLIQAIASQKKKYRNSTFQLVQDTDYDSIRDAYRAIGQGEFFMQAGESNEVLTNQNTNKN